MSSESTSDCIDKPLNSDFNSLCYSVFWISLAEAKSVFPGPQWDGLIGVHSADDYIPSDFQTLPLLPHSQKQVDMPFFGVSLFPRDVS